MISALLGFLGAILYFFLCLVFATVTVIGCILGWIVLSEWFGKLQEQLQPLCPACRRTRLTRHRLGFADRRTYRYYGCGQCRAHFKRTRFGRWLTLPPGAANEGEVKALFWRPSSLMKAADPAVDAGPFGSWFGKVQVALPGETWPEYNGVPMLPLCQLRCEEIPTLPAVLSEFALIAVFVAFTDQKTLSSEGARWVVRTYSTLDDLIPIAYPGDPTAIRSYPIAWEVERKDTPPGFASVPEALWIEFVECGLDKRHAINSSKVGGFRSGQIEKVPSLELQKDFVFQTALQGDFPWLRGQGGTFAFSYAPHAPAERWSLDWDAPESQKREGKAVQIGCEAEGMRLYLEWPPDFDANDTLGMAHQGRSGPVRHMGDLRGAVHITTGAEALQYLRLCSCGLFHAPEISGCEVLTQEVYVALPHWYHAGMWDPWSSLNGTTLQDRTQLDPQTFRSLGLEPATVEAIDGGFRIVRWVYRFPLPGLRKPDEDPDEAPYGAYWKLSETVTPDGGYNCTALEKRAAPENELLRAASRPDEKDPDELVRPASGPGETDPDELVRPDAPATQRWGSAQITETTVNLTQGQTLFLKLLLGWLFASTSVILLLSWSNPVQRAVVGMGAALILLWIVLCGGLMWRFRHAICGHVQAIHLDWRLKFVLSCTLLALTEEAITTSLTNLAPLFGVKLGQAYITASANYLDMIALHGVSLFVSFFVGWAVLLRRYAFSPFAVFVLFGITGTLVEMLFSGWPHILEYGMWAGVYGGMIWLPAACVPADRDALPPRWWHYPLAVFVPFLFMVLFPLLGVISLFFPHHPRIHFPPMR